MTRHLWIERNPFETRWAISEQGRLVAADIWPRGHQRAVGAINAGRVRKVIPEMGGAFVDLGAAGDGWLRAKDARWLKPAGNHRGIQYLVHEGEAVVVQIDRAAMAGKGPRVTADIRLDLPGRSYRPRQPGAADPVGQALWQQIIGAMKPPPACLWRDDQPVALAARSPKLSAVSAAPDLLSDPALAGLAAHPITAGRPVLPDEFDERLNGLTQPRLDLANGVWLLIEPTAALTAIDVNAGPLAPYPANLAAAQAIGRELQLRQIGGLIVVDFVGLGDRQEIERIEQALSASCDDDPLAVQCGRMSANGLCEIVRQKADLSLFERLYQGDNFTGWRLTAMAQAAAAWRAAQALANGRPGPALDLSLPEDSADLFDQSVLEHFQLLTGRRLCVTTGPYQLSSAG